MSGVVTFTAGDLVWVAAGCLAGWISMRVFDRIRLGAARDQADRLRREAHKEADNTRREAEVAARAELLNARERFESETRDRRQELAALEKHLAQREAKLDRRMDLLDHKEEDLDREEERLEKLERRLTRDQQELEEARLRQRAELERISGLSAAQAKEQLLQLLETELRSEAGALVRRIEEEARLKAEEEARRIITMAIERVAAGHANDTLTTSVALPSDDMKGRIIGREGRNIRALESATGVSVLIDDTPQAVVISGFDPVRKEVARQALERLILDGRIHPTRIEEIVEKVRGEVDETIRKAGEEAVFKVGVQGVHPDIVRTLGRLRFRTSFSQNVLDHSVEVALLMGMMATELGLDSQIAKRVGLFHDIGKAVGHEVEGSHALVGADLLRRHGEPPEICNGVASHHDEVEPEGIWGILAGAADAISASRPGARSETTAIYIRRLENLEEIARGFAGVQEAYAIQAGREIRVIVEPTRVSDNEAAVLAREVSRRIEQELQYPGQIQVTVIRETRAVEYAR